MHRVGAVGRRIDDRLRQAARLQGWQGVRVRLGAPVRVDVAFGHQRRHGRNRRSGQGRCGLHDVDGQQELRHRHVRHDHLGPDLRRRQRCRWHQRRRWQERNQWYGRRQRRQRD